MPNLLTSLEIDLRWLGALAGLSALGYAIYRMLRAQRRPAGHQTGSARQILRTRYLVVATVLFIALAVLLWRPLPIQLSYEMQLVVSLVGAAIYFFGIGLYLWGMQALGENFNASSGFGVRLQQTHQLVSRGPYTYVRHPMYSGVILACWGGLMLYRTWTMLVLAFMMLGLFYRARAEDQALAKVFGETWQNYQRRVPGFFPRLPFLQRKKPRKQRRGGRAQR